MYLTDEEGGGGIEPDPLRSGHCYRVHLLHAAQSGFVLNYQRHPDCGEIFIIKLEKLSKLSIVLQMFLFRILSNCTSC
jgi:hypothetical protein